MGRRRLLLGLLAFGVVAVAVFVWVWRGQSREPDPRVVIVEQFLAEQHGQESWYQHITGLEMRGDDLRVRTNLPETGISEPNRSGIEQQYRPIYNALWDYAVFQRPELGIGRVIILNRNGAYLGGGQG